MVDWPRTEAMPHLLVADNLGLVFMRQVAMGDQYSHFGVTRIPIDARAFYSNKGIMSVAPLYLYRGVGRQHSDLFMNRDQGKDERDPNLDPGFVRSIEQATGTRFISEEADRADVSFGPLTLLAYIYAVFHSPEFRRRFESALKLDFPRVPVPGGAGVFWQLSHLGHELMALHLLESPVVESTATSYLGPSEPVVGRVGWCSETVWLDAGTVNARDAYIATRPGSMGFVGVTEEVWRFRMGGYQVCHKWLKDRKGRALSDGDIAHYQRISTAIGETIRIMAEIDDVIDSHGGWPDAFVTESRSGGI
jgi:hypothetical protein